MIKDYTEKLTQEELKELLHYNPMTGIFTWKVDGNNQFVKKGNIAGGKETSGYIVIVINKRNYKAHRLAWLYRKGYFPENEIDHINRKRDDNRFCNLREVSRQCNSRNSKISKLNTSGITGVNYHSFHKKWGARIYNEKKRIHLGYFKKFINAVKARWKAEKKYNYPNCNTASSSYLFLKKEGVL